MKKTLLISAATALSLLTFAEAALAAEGRVRARGENGAVAAGSKNGNSYVRGRGATTHSDGSTTAGSSGAYRLNNGAQGGRASTTTVNPDGSASHQGGFAASGAKGSVTSQGSASRNADGTGSGSRSTDITNAQTGNSYSGTTTYDTTNGVNHQSSCRDASGTEVACPR